MVMPICAYASWYAATVLRRELRLQKLMRWLKRKERFAHALAEGTGESLWSALHRAMAVLLCTQKRKRKTSQQLLAEERPSRERYTQGAATMVDQAA